MIETEEMYKNPDGRILLHEVRALFLRFSYMLFSLNLPINYVLVKKRV